MQELMTKEFTKVGFPSMMCQGCFNRYFLCIVVPSDLASMIHETIENPAAGICSRSTTC